MEEIDFKELFSIFWNKRLLIIASTIIFIIIGAVYSYTFTTPMYSSSTKLVLATSGTSNKGSNSDDNGESITTTDITLNTNLVSTYSELVKSKRVLEDVIKNLGIEDSYNSLKRKVSVNSVKTTSLIDITVTHENPVYAAKIANEIGKVFSNEIIPEYYKMSNVYLVDEAEVPNAPSNINHVKDIIIFAFAGMLIAAAYIFILNMLDNTIKTAEDIEKLYQLPVLVTIPSIENFDMDKNGKGGRK